MALTRYGQENPFTVQFDFIRIHSLCFRVISSKQREMARVHRGVKWVNVLFACQEVIEWVRLGGVAVGEKESVDADEEKRENPNGEDFPRANYIDFHVIQID